MEFAHRQNNKTYPNNKLFIVSRFGYKIQKDSQDTKLDVTESKKTEI